MHRPPLVCWTGKLMLAIAKMTNSSIWQVDDFIASMWQYHKLHCNKTDHMNPSRTLHSYSNSDNMSGKIENWVSTTLTDQEIEMLSISTFRYAYPLARAGLKCHLTWPWHSTARSQDRAIIHFILNSSILHGGHLARGSLLLPHCDLYEHRGRVAACRGVCMHHRRNWHSGGVMFFVSTLFTLKIIPQPRPPAEMPLLHFTVTLDSTHSFTEMHTCTANHTGWDTAADLENCIFKESKIQTAFWPMDPECNLVK